MGVPVMHDAGVAELLLRLDAWRTIADQAGQDAYVDALSFLMLMLELQRFDSRSGIEHLVEEMRVDAALRGDVDRSALVVRARAVIGAGIW